MKLFEILAGRILTIFLLLPLSGSSCALAKAPVEAPSRPRLIVTTDIGGDPDDTQSMIRLLMYSNDFNICGIISSASGTRGELGLDTIQPGRILALIDAYGKVVPSLRKHDGRYPDADYLRERVKRGNPHRGIAFIGEGYDTEGSDWIIQQVDESEEITHISIWGGQTDVAQALWRVKNDRDFEAYYAFISKIMMYDINDQDGIYSYIREQFPELVYILAKAPEGVDKREGAYRGMYLGGDESLTSSEWITRNVKEGHGPLGALYPMKTWTAPNPYGCLKEGDTPSWFYYLENGLQDSGHPSWGGWGGRFEPDLNSFFRDAKDFAGEDINARATVYRWREAYQHDFAARMDWCVKEPGQANHAPLVVVEGDQTREVMHIQVSQGGSITLSTNDTMDPDGDSLSYHWWIYPEPGTARQCPEMWPIDQPSVTLQIPGGEAGNTMHLVCEVTDDGQPAMTSYRRVVLHITE